MKIEFTILREILYSDKIILKFFNKISAAFILKTYSFHGRPEEQKDMAAKNAFNRINDIFYLFAKTKDGSYNIYSRFSILWKFYFDFLFSCI